MSPVRNAPAQRSSDLTDGEVRRSVGLLEGLLSLSIRQRKATAKTLAHFEALDSSISSMLTVTSRREVVLLQQNQTTSS
ncbi:MAG: hypothetical protein M1823_008488, partial [Watsoniomyces obsoletus]